MAKSLKLGDILGGETFHGSERAERLQEVVMGESHRGRVGVTRSVSPVRRAKRGCVERVSVVVSVDKLNALRLIGIKYGSVFLQIE